MVCEYHFLSGALKHTLLVLLMSTCNICFCEELLKIITEYILKYSSLSSPLLRYMALFRFWDRSCIAPDQRGYQVFFCTYLTMKTKALLMRTYVFVVK